MTMTNFSGKNLVPSQMGLRSYAHVLLYSGTFGRCTQNSVYGVSLNNAFMPKSDWRSIKSSVSVVILS